MNTSNAWGQADYVHTVGDAPAERELAPLTIVCTAGHRYGVILGRTDSPYVEYRVQLVEVEGNYWHAGLQGLFGAAEVATLGFCEADYLPGLILAAAAGYSHRYGDRYTEVTR